MVYVSLPENIHKMTVSSQILQGVFSLFSNMYPEHHPNVGKYPIHGSYGHRGNDDIYQCFFLGESTIFPDKQCVEKFAEIDETSLLIESQILRDVNQLSSIVTISIVI